MSNLNDKLINQAYKGLIHTSDEAAITGTPKRLQDGEGNNLPVEVGTSSMKYYGTQDFTNATVLGISGGGGGSGTSGTDGTSGTSGTDGSSGSSGSSGVSPAGGGGGGGGDIIALSLIQNVNTFWQYCYKPIIASNGAPTANLVYYRFGATSQVSAVPTNQFKAGDTIDEIAFFVQDASATATDLVIGIHDSILLPSGELAVGQLLHTLTNDVALVQTTGFKQLTGLGITVADNTSGTGIYFATWWTVGPGDSDHLTVKGESVAPSSKAWYRAYSGVTQFAGGYLPCSNEYYAGGSYPIAGFDLGTATGVTGFPAIGFK